MKTFKEYVIENEEGEHTTEWMSGKELSKHISKTAHKKIVYSDEHKGIQNHDLAHGGSGNLHYRIHTKSYGGTFKTKRVEVASAKKDKDGFIHHTKFGVMSRSASNEGGRMKTHKERKVTVPFHWNDDKIKQSTGR